MAPQINRQYQLAQYPSGLPDRDTFSFVGTPLGKPTESQILVKNKYLSLNPAIRGWMNDVRSYIPPVGIGRVICTLDADRALISKHPGFQIGDYVSGTLGMQDYFVGEPKGFYKIDLPRASLPHYLSALGMTGMAAYFTLPDAGQPKSGETVVISGVTDAVGSIAGQIARLGSYRVVGIASDAEKCHSLVGELGFDGAIDYRNEDLATGPKHGYPKNIDTFSDDVDGEILDTMLTYIVFRAHIAPCGAIDQYNNKEAVRGPASYLSLLVSRTHMGSIVMMDYAQRFPGGLKEMTTWLAEGKPQSREDVVEGLETFPKILPRLFSRENFDKLVLKV